MHEQNYSIFGEKKMHVAIATSTKIAVAISAQKLQLRNCSVLDSFSTC